MSRWNLKVNPVLILGGLVAVLTAVTTWTDIANMVPEVVLNWLRLATVVLSVLGAYVVRSKVTPLADPRDEHGAQLVPSTRQQAAGFLPAPPSRTFTSTTGSVLAAPSDALSPKEGRGGAQDDPPSLHG